MVEGLSVTVDTISGPLDIINVYCPPQEFFVEAWFKEQFQRPRENVLICDDFSGAKRVLMGSPEGDSRGYVLETILDECDKVVRTLVWLQDSLQWERERAILI